MATYPGKPYDEIIHPGSIFKIFEKRFDWNSSSFKYPGPAHHIRVTFHFSALIPIERAIYLPQQ
jgi:hypothetical protein